MPEPFFQDDKLTALQAKESAQWIAFGPTVFQAARVLRNSGILQVIEDSRRNGIGLDAIAQKVNLPVYGVRVLLEAGLSIGLVTVRRIFTGSRKPAISFCMIRSLA